MNKKVYSFLLNTYGRHAGIWFGVVAEVIRTLLQRVVVTIIVAQLAADLANHNLVNAQQHVLWFLAAYCSGALIGAVGDLVAVFAENHTYEKLGLAFYKKITGKDMAFYRDHQTGYLVSLFRQHLDGLMFLNRLIRGDVVRMIISLLAPVVVLFFAGPALGFVALAIIIVQAIYITWASTKATKYRELAHEIYRRVTGIVSDHITNIVAFKSGGREAEAVTTLDELQAKETQTFWLRRKVSVFLDLPRELATAIGVAAAFFVVVNGVQTRGSSVALIILTITYMFQIIRSISDLPNLVLQMDDQVTKIYPTLAYLTNDSETVRDPAKSKKLTITKGTITLRHVDFSYPAQQRSEQIAVFNDLNITIPGGQHVGIVGLSGAGKSTLTSLLLRFDDVTDGSITIDGTDVRHVTQANLHQQIAYVPQEPLLFHATVRENIAMFNANVTEQKIIAAATAAHAHDFIQTLPQGYETMVGERGVKLSGGQKQRVVIARAILKNAPIMILDEATSALDTESEKIIQQALPTIIGKHTAIVIAHRLSTLAGLDRILVMHDGKIIEDGTHQQLLDLKGRYFRLWQKQIHKN
ncbi:MAG TPA: ABC transporter ATP-binding protein [Candidatus Saccharimonas sp.]|nr:ABC transporter ATP-binding protein [Candidatus Saccharimonas sp.]